MLNYNEWIFSFSEYPTEEWLFLTIVAYNYQTEKASVSFPYLRVLPLS